MASRSRSQCEKSFQRWSPLAKTSLSQPGLCDPGSAPPLDPEPHQAKPPIPKVRKAGPSNGIRRSQFSSTNPGGHRTLSPGQLHQAAPGLIRRHSPSQRALR
ncbi:hypothetical protein NDU88_008044 [Pleurodeles waltl]|uniref:Uncharacterized protein n=1 Tax=Pleurodeles waltl TaxID=8319 RepID=A0AAV7PT73_PLEWA|nr:hypothetical protein NDU88_008044 [Pleurodeles waltl]